VVEEEEKETDPRPRLIATPSLQEVEATLGSTLEVVHRFLQSPGRLAWYPSAGRHVPGLLELAFDTYVLTDFGTCVTWDRMVWRRDSDGSGWAWFKDESGRQLLSLMVSNRGLLPILRDMGSRLDGFIGNNDGCCEGGNNECVNDQPFVTEVLGLAADPFTWITDHAFQLMPGGMAEGCAFVRRVEQQAVLGPYLFRLVDQRIIHGIRPQFHDRDAFFEGRRIRDGEGPCD